MFDPSETELDANLACVVECVQASDYQECPPVDPTVV
jgi:hypothetical protein